MTNRRKTRDRIYQRKRRLRRQVIAGKITPLQMEALLAAYARRQAAQQAPQVEASENIPPHILAMIQACIQYDRNSGAAEGAGAWQRDRSCP